MFVSIIYVDCENPKLEILLSGTKIFHSIYVQELDKQYFLNNLMHL